MRMTVNGISPTEKETVLSAVIQEVCEDDLVHIYILF